MAEAYNFEDVSEEKNRKSSVWQGFFWLDKKKEVARCQKCLEKGVTKYMQSTKGGTKSLHNHIEKFHKIPDSQSLSRIKTKPQCFAKRYEKKKSELTSKLDFRHKNDLRPSLTYMVQICITLGFH